MITRTIDSKGRLLLGKEYAGRQVIIDDQEPDRLVIMTATTVPDRELWLYCNKRALDDVLTGLEQAKRGEFVPGPDKKKVAALAANIKD
jgi:hypothetical protein